jgi:AAA domain
MMLLRDLDHVAELAEAQGIQVERITGRKDSALELKPCPGCRDGYEATATWDGLGVILSCQGCKHPAAIRDGLLIGVSHDPGIVSMADIQMRSIEYLERPLWQRSAFHLLAGPKGAGKGTYLAHFAAKRTLQGDNVLFVSSEDSASVDLKPRLVACQAVVQNCYLVTRRIKLPNDIPWLQEQAESIGAVGVIIIDPVANHIGDKRTNDEGEIRDAIAPLNKLADDLDTAIIGVRHPGKDKSRGALASVLGSTAWVDTPRVVNVIAPDDEDADVRHIQVVGGNRSRVGVGRMFRIEAVRVGDLAEPVTMAVELGQSSKDIDDLLSARRGDSEPSNSEVARDLILDTLEAAPGMEHESDDLDAKVAAETGLAAKTVKNIRVKLGKDGLVKAYPVKDGEGEIKRWMVRRTSAVRT